MSRGNLKLMLGFHGTSLLQNVFKIVLVPCYRVGNTSKTIRPLIEFLADLLRLSLIELRTAADKDKWKEEAKLEAIRALERVLVS